MPQRWRRTNNLAEALESPGEISWQFPIRGSRASGPGEPQVSGIFGLQSVPGGTPQERCRSSQQGSRRSDRLIRSGLFDPRHPADAGCKPSYLSEHHSKALGTRPRGYRDRTAVNGSRPSRTRRPGGRDRVVTVFPGRSARSIPSATATLRSLSLPPTSIRRSGTGRLAKKHSCVIASFEIFNNFVTELTTGSNSAERVEQSTPEMQDRNRRRTPDRRIMFSLFTRCVTRDRKPVPPGGRECSRAKDFSASTER